MAQVSTVSIGNQYLNPADTNQYVGDGLPSIDIRHGGQWGALPIIGGIANGKSINEWMHEQKYQKRPVIPTVISVPKMFDLLPNAAAWKSAVKAMIEVHAKTITGIDSSLTVETAEADLGISGAKFREAVKVTRASTNISITLEEKTGNPFEILLDVWIRYGLEDPELGAPLITRIVKKNKLPSIWSPEWTTMTVLYTEPDVFLRKPVHAWLVSNHFPTTNPDITGGKDKMASREFKDLSLELGGFAIPHTNKRVKKLAQVVLNNLELWNKDPEDMLLPSDTVDPTIADIDGVNIYYDGIKGNTNSNAGGTTGSATA